ncbi:MAG: FKBP-type peptidyl-prolyl cis-trans isomerase [Coriobacteriales bacterium]|jgi:FKBP-type peptidyl-prolyl cis-trans isomerase/uncharacterized membrane protein|nr:FKBP-type peptidyl-prolyl cis-trans isomerase [Coriobacteriales bacterium]
MKLIGKMNVLLMCLVAGATLTALATLGACAPAVAATVNGTAIPEQEITDSIEAMRQQSTEFQEPVTWAKALAGSSMTPESLRESVIDTKVREIVIVQQAESDGYVVDQAAIDAQVEQVKATVGGDEKNWIDTLQRYGFKNEQAYRDTLVTDDLSKQMYEAYTPEPTAEELEQYVVANAVNVEGYTAPEDGVVYADVPADVVEQLKEQWVQTNKSTKFQAYVEELVEAADVIINPMPDNVPYNVDMSLAEDSSSSTGSTSEGDSESPSTTGTTSTPEAVEAAKAAGLIIEDVVGGDGEEAVDGSTVSVLYTGKLEDGTIFDTTANRNNEPFEFTLGQARVIKGWDAGVVGMKVGGKRLLTIPPDLGYGANGTGNIPPNSTLIFEIELLSATPAG